MIGSHGVPHCVIGFLMQFSVVGFQEYLDQARISGADMSMDDPTLEIQTGLALVQDDRATFLVDLTVNIREQAQGVDAVGIEQKGLQEGDVFRPFATLKAAEAKVASGGTIRMIPSDTTERDPIGVGKRFMLIAPIGQVKIGVI